MQGQGRAHVASELGHRASTSPPGGSDQQPGSSPGTESTPPDVCGELGPFLPAGRARSPGPPWMTRAVSPERESPTRVLLGLVFLQAALTTDGTDCSSGKCGR